MTQQEFREKTTKIVLMLQDWMLGNCPCSQRYREAGGGINLMGKMIGGKFRSGHTKNREPAGTEVALPSSRTRF